MPFITEVALSLPHIFERVHMYIPGPVLGIVSSLLSIGTPSFVHILSTTELLRLFGHSIVLHILHRMDCKI